MVRYGKDLYKENADETFLLLTRNTLGFSLTTSFKYKSASVLQTQVSKLTHMHKQPWKFYDNKLNDSIWQAF